jgi:hypothetical protein
VTNAGPIYDVTFSADGRSVSAATFGGEIFTWDMEANPE